MTDDTTTPSVEVNPKPENSTELADLIESLTVFEHDGGAGGYEQSAEAMWRAARAAFDYAARRVGATGYQASWAALKFYAEEMGIDGAFMVVKARDALYPQYDIPARVETFLAEQRDWLADEAKKRLAGDLTMVADWVERHWRILAAGGKP